MNTNLSTTQEQSARLLRCGVSADAADMHIDYYGELWASPYKDNQRKDEKDFTPVWTLSALLGLLPFKIHSCKYEYWLDVAPINFGTQWSIGYYCTEKPRTIKGLTHTESLIECAVQEIEWLSANGYKLKGGTDGEN